MKTEHGVLFQGSLVQQSLSKTHSTFNWHTSSNRGMEKDRQPSSCKQARAHFVATNEFVDRSDDPTFKNLAEFPDPIVRAIEFLPPKREMCIIIADNRYHTIMAKLH